MPGELLAQPTSAVRIDSVEKNAINFYLIVSHCLLSSKGREEV